MRRTIFSPYIATLLFVITSVFGSSVSRAVAQEQAKVLYVPLIGISMVPDPLTLPEGTGAVTYRYAVKNFRTETPLTDVQVVDNNCHEISFVTGDDDLDGQLDADESWRYVCTTTRTQTTRSTATATGSFSGVTTADDAHATVVVGSDTPPPLVSIVNITKVAYPLSLPAEGGVITYTYRVNNPGRVPLSDVRVTDDKCRAMSGKLGDTNGNNLLDVTEVWSYTCTAILTQTTTNTAEVRAFANDQQAVDTFLLTVKVDTPPVVQPVTQSIAAFPETGFDSMFNVTVWAVLSCVLAVLIFVVVGMRIATKKGRRVRMQPPWKRLIVLVCVAVYVAVAVTVCAIIITRLQPDPTITTAVDKRFGWKYPVAAFPATGGAEGVQLAYSDVRDPGGIPQGLPVRLRIPVIGVDSVVEDALITPDGRMDVPAGSTNVAWFALGPPPGQEGSAVIGGHYGIRDGIPFVFYKLDLLKRGDEVFVMDDKGDTLRFVVRDIQLFDRDADATTVFTSQDGLAHLNLITCEGIWNQVNNTYPQRRVVFTDAVMPDGSAPVDPPEVPAPVLIPRPDPVPSLPVIPVVNPLTGSESTPAQPSPTLTQFGLNVIAQLFGTPADGLITSALLLSILIVAHELLRRLYAFMRSRKARTGGRA